MLATHHVERLFCEVVRRQPLDTIRTTTGRAVLHPLVLVVLGSCYIALGGLTINGHLHHTFRCGTVPHSRVVNVLYSAHAIHIILLSVTKQALFRDASTVLRSLWPQAHGLSVRYQALTKRSDIFDSAATIGALWHTHHLLPLIPSGIPEARRATQSTVRSPSTVVKACPGPPTKEGLIPCDTISRMSFRIVTFTEIRSHTM